MVLRKIVTVMFLFRWNIIARCTVNTVYAMKHLEIMVSLCRHTVAYKFNSDMSNTMYITVEFETMFSQRHVSFDRRRKKDGDRADKTWADK